MNDTFKSRVRGDIKAMLAWHNNN